MNKPSPLQRVKAQHGSKEALVDKVVELLEAENGETKDELKARLRLVANAKLLHLLALGQRAKELGGRDGVVAKVAELRGQAKDADFVAKLKTRTLGQLLDMHASLSRKASA